MRLKTYLTCLLANRRNEVMIMTGKFYDVDEWLKLIEKDKEMSEGAKWWLSRVRLKSESYS